MLEDLALLKLRKMMLKQMLLELEQNKIELVKLQICGWISSIEEKERNMI